MLYELDTEGERHMPRIPRIAPALVATVALTALIAAASATGRSQTAPKLEQEPYIASKVAVVVGATLTGDKGSWSGTAPITYSYQWMRCNGEALSCVKIKNATGTTYEIVKNDVGHTIRFQVTAQNADGKQTALSNATGTVPGAASAPAVLIPPKITGNAVVGEKLTATTGTWQGTNPIDFTIVWQRCNAGETSCAKNGTKGTSYTVAKDDVGKRLRVKVNAKNAAGSGSALSDTTAVVTGTTSGGGGTGGAVPVTDVGPAGERLVVDKVVFNPNPVTSRNVPIQVTITVKDTKGHLVKGALVFFRSTPIVTSTPTDAPTGNDGTVTYSIQPRSDFPIKNGYSVQFFAKAYRAGDPGLAGISGTRLVQVATHTP
jgi:hypothetical protein